jgi:hypothetical protein
MLSAADRAPAPDRLSWHTTEKLASPEELKGRGVKLQMLCGQPEHEVNYAEPGYAAEIKSGYAYDGWPSPVPHCRASEKSVEIAVTVPKNAAGTLRLYLIDPDNWQDGRKETVTVAGKSLGTIEEFQQGRWLEQPLTAAETESGEILVKIDNVREKANAVISILEWVQK